MPCRLLRSGIPIVVILVLTACAVAERRNDTAIEADAMPVTYDCGGLLVDAVFGEGSATLVIDDRVLELAAVPAASGARYAMPGSSDTGFWTKGVEATLVIDGERYPLCELTPALFRATGNEPAWILMIAGSTMTLSLDYGKTTHVLPRPLPKITRALARYETEAEGHELDVAIRDRICTDSMTGMPYPASVTVMFDGRTLAGCGGDPNALLAGPEWSVLEIAGARLVEGSTVTLNFDDQGGLAGTAGCNRYGASYELGGEGLRIGPARSTRMACPEPLMAQENRFFAVLESVTAFRIDDRGQLVLVGADGDSITARRTPSAAP